MSIIIAFTCQELRTKVHSVQFLSMLRNRNYMDTFLRFLTYYERTTNAQLILSVSIGLIFNWYSALIYPKIKPLVHNQEHNYLWLSVVRNNKEYFLFIKDNYKK